ncbi:MAG: thymidine phosphorylase [Oscillospiraceae bacterium]|nr:thymidine phosphorylase [Oscillospiraceae bacterium]
MNILDIISKTKHKIPLEKSEIGFLVENYTGGKIPDYQMSAWLMAVCLNSLTDDETTELTLAMRDSGQILDLSRINGITADKHSTGGVGDKTSLIIAPAVASCGVYVPKMSGRGLGHTGGTIDKLESIEGYRTEMPLDEFISIVNKTGFSIISQNENLCPADKKIYALRNSTGTVDSIPLICSSIMSKKLAVSADCILLDVKYGSGAFMKTKEDAERLAELMQNTGINAGKKCRCDVTDMNSPLGMNIGNALEVKEAIEILQGKNKGDLYKLCIDLSADMLSLAGQDNCREKVQNAIDSGKALEVFRETLMLHGGNYKICDNVSMLPQAKYSYEVKSDRTGTISEINSEEIGMTSLILGAGRITKNQPVDPSAGIILNCKKGNKIQKGDLLMTLYSSKITDFSEAERRALNSMKIM